MAWKSGTIGPVEASGATGPVQTISATGIVKAGKSTKSTDDRIISGRISQVLHQVVSGTTFGVESRAASGVATDNGASGAELEPEKAIKDG